MSRAIELAKECEERSFEMRGDHNRWRYMDIAKELRRLAAVERERDDAKILLDLTCFYGQRQARRDYYDIYFDAEDFGVGERNDDGQIPLGLPCPFALPLPDDVRAKLEQTIGGDHAKS